MLQIEDLQVKLGDKEILKHIDLEILPGETHILFGPNWSGKTSLLMTIMGYPQYRVTGGKILFICCRALEVQGVRLRTPYAFHLQHPVNAYSSVVQ